MKRNRTWLRVAALCAMLTVLFSALPMVVFAAYENTYQNTGNQPMDIVGVAKTQIGYTEGANNKNKYSDYYNNPNQPWCGYFISWCARQANISTSIVPNSGLASAFKNVGTYHKTGSGYIPQTGDFAYYSSGHVSIVERYDEATGKVWLIDGNWSDKVSNHSVSLTSTAVEGYASPNYIREITELSVFNLVKPTTLLKGKSFSIGGVVCSPKKLTKVTLQVQDANGKNVISASATPNKKEYDLSGLDSKVAFGTLVAGEYMYVVSATDESGASKRWTSTFEVVSEITITLTDVKAPTSLKVGQSFSIYGKLTCDEPFTLVSAGVYDATGTYKTGGTAKPSGNTYDVHNLDAYVSFGKLAAGSYTLRIAGRSENAYKRWEYPFVVGDGSPVFTLNDAVVPETLSCGRDFTFKGKISCSTSMTAASVKILQGTKELAKAVAYPNTTSYSIDALNSKIDFSTLKVGSYRVRVAATGGGVTKEWFYDFKVVGENNGKGDINFDGYIDSRDTMMLYQHASGASVLTEDQLEAVAISPANMAAAFKLYAYTSGDTLQYP